MENIEPAALESDIWSENIVYKREKWEYKCDWRGRMYTARMSQKRSKVTLIMVLVKE